jgi:hypothetical protein
MSHDKKRLSNDFFQSDFTDFLNSNKDDNVLISFKELKKWIEDYELQISKNIEILHDLVKNIFPKKYFTITNVEDDNSTFSINIFGCTPEECKMSNYVEVENIIQKYFNNQYFFMLHKVSLGSTIDYYPKELKEAIRLGFITEKDVSEYLLRNKK